MDACIIPQNGDYMVVSLVYVTSKSYRQGSDTLKTYQPITYSPKRCLLIRNVQMKLHIFERLG